MATSNNFDLPAPLYKALTPDRRIPVLKRISATALIDAPLQRILKMKHFNDIKEDASENLWALLGSAVHVVVEKSGSVDTSEVKETYEHPLGVTLVTVGDYYDNEILTDWKITSVWSFMLGTKDEWINQLNVVKYIYEKKGIPVKKMQVYAILRDHMKSKIYDSGYPQIPFQKMDIPVIKNMEAYIESRINLHLAAEELIDDPAQIPQCSPKERWQRPTVYAVKKKDQKKAVRVLDTIEDATAYMQNNCKGAGTYYIETRVGADIKCQDYCSVNTFCEYYKKSNVGPSGGGDGD